ncbi:Conserved oligomeric Golgi complex subunit 6 [Ostreococcus tauri]|uniref:Conserved oligomeric Golgi complex subunit 6 n=1 Tax=Ostreococcus tauri TaxID=70448 RepID=Q00T18_OSTTA|nr:Conserved oligomeric Golgi complex subunit 6 [Ostreococcus tauri]CAL57998.1 Conserved oligomeric Golgi complex subunit 6 [Ostreococcus tauri]|eukprot:XP_003084031.1 Conserved oligomeric Golgi complex subunit 6 [Ostreococcus tauri]
MRATTSATTRATTTTSATTSATTTQALASGFARRIDRALALRLSDDAVVGSRTRDDEGGEGDDGGETTSSRATAPRVDLATCVRALSDILSSQHKTTTPCASVNVRAAVERRGLALNESFLDASLMAQTKLSQVEATLAALDGARERMQRALDGSKQKTSALLREAERASEDLRSIESRRELVKSFAVDFQITKAQVDALTTVEDDSAASVDLPAAFFPALERVKVIQSNCSRLTKDADQQRAGLQMLDAMTSYAETAHEKLRRWFVAKCRMLAEEDDFITEGDERTLRKAVRELRSRPTLFRASVEEVTRTRHNALFRRFITALTRGSVGSKPLEVHAHDPLRYVGDMLSWVHAAVASEREFCDAVFGDDGQASDRDVSEGELAFDPAKELLGKVFDAVCRPLKVRVEQVLASVSSTSEGGVMTAYKLAHLLMFYYATLGDLLDDGSALIKAVRDLRESSKTSFADAVAQHGGKYKKLSLAPTTVSGDDALAPPAALRDGLSNAIELLDAVSTSASSAAASDDETRELIALALNGLIDPILLAVEAASARMTDQIKSVIGSSADAPKWAPDAFALNCLYAIREPLRSHASANVKVNDLNRAISKKLTEVADAEAGALLAATGLSDALELVVLYQEQGNGIMANDPALRIDQVANALSALVDAAGTKAPEFESIQAPSVRRDIAMRYNERLVEAYTRVYAALLTPSSGYGANVREKIRHGPDALSTVLGES